ncbi:MAG: multifunctional CCA addition/repair protein [Gammaproteobacteria bacterium]|nr:multifunctional CCA addition/repair protein [Gammaproteobacteria bacterium]
MESYLVGGAVRDKLLGIPVKDEDWVVVGARPEDLLAQGYRQVGKGFPVFLHPETQAEYALARTERKTGRGHNAFDFNASDQVTLEQDLSRRDLTINAMAESTSGELIDPYGGQADLENRLLKHVSAAFSEDPLRVLRVARFAARFAHLGFKVADETMNLMHHMVASGELDTLVAERVWQETEAALTSPSPQEFINVLRQCGALAIILPEVDALFGVPQPKKYHPEIDTGVHTLMCLEQVAKLSDDSAVRYATLVHDVGKAVTDQSKWPSHFGHETLGLPLQNQVAKRLRIPNEHAQLAALVCEHHTKLHRVQQLRPTTVLSLLESLDALRRPERLEKFLLACEADARGRTGFEDRDYPQRAYLTAILEAVTLLDIEALLADHPNRSPAELIRDERLQIVSGKIAELEITDA